MVKRNKNQEKHQKIAAKHEHFKSGAPSHSNASTNPARKVNKESEGFYRTKSKIKILNMYNEKANLKTMYVEPQKPVRIEPNRKWFGNVRTVDQKQLEKFRVEVAQQTKDPYQVLIKTKMLPISLIKDNVKENRMNLLEVESYEDTFGPKSRRKKPKIDSSSMVNMLEKVEKKAEEYKHEKDVDLQKNNGEPDQRTIAKDKMLGAGQSRRIWEELYKVLDSSDVVCQILDARDPMGTRCRRVEDHIKKNCPQKHIILILNKCDLVPVWVTKKWLRILSKEHPTLAFHATVNTPFGRGALMQLLRQFDNFHKDKKTISVGFIGYPNVGKSSVINSLKARKVCRAAPIPGETKVWQYITLTKRIYLIDCPGVVYNLDNEIDVEVVLKGVVRAERLDDPTLYIHGILERADKKDLQKIYEIQDWEDEDEFLTLIAHKKGRLLKGAEPDLKTVATMLINDWQRGKIPYFAKPPGADVPGEKDKLDDKLEDKEDVDLEEDEEIEEEGDKVEEEGKKVEEEGKKVEEEGKKVEEEGKEVVVEKIKQIEA